MSNKAADKQNLDWQYILSKQSKFYSPEHRNCLGRPIMTEKLNTENKILLRAYILSIKDSLVIFFIIQQ